MNLFSFRRSVLWSAAASCGLAVFLTAPVQAKNTFPHQPVRLVVPFAPGGSSDTATRVLAELLTQKWGQTVVVENKPGANGSLGAMQVARAKPDGHTLLVTPVSIGTIELFLKNPGFDRNKDLVPVTQFAKGDYVLAAHPSLPAKTFAEFVEHARQHPEKVFHGSFGGASRLAFEGFALANKITPVNVNYRGEALALQALIAGDVQVVLSTLVGAKPFIEAGRIKPLGIPAKVRNPIAPNVLSADESGAPGFYADFWFGLMAPAGTQQEAVNKIAADVAEVLARPAVAQRFQELGLLAVSSTPAEFAALIKYESERWVDVAKHAEIEPQ